MRITRLHILLGLIGLVLVGFGIFRWMQHQVDHVPMMTPPRSPIVKKQAPLVPSHAPTTVPAAHPAFSAAPAEKGSAARLIATVGEAYHALPKPAGEIPSIAQPLRAAKDYWASGQFHLAIVCAQQAWIALKNNPKANEPAGESYEVVKGDTLWRIARDHSPVHQGPGWVTLWKANRRVIKDFNRIEVGWNLTIPAKPSRYIEPYWRPRDLAHAGAPGPSPVYASVRNQPPASLQVNLPEVLAWAHAQKIKTIQATSLYAYLAAKETNGSWTPSRKTTVPNVAHLASAHRPALRLAAATGEERLASFSVPARPFLESPQYQ